MIVVTDTSDEGMLPIPDDMLVSLNDSYDIIANLLDNLPYYFSETANPSRENAMNHALNQCFNIAQHIGGRIFLFQASQNVTALPELALKPEAAKETHAKFSSSNMYYAKKASELAHCQVSVDLFVFTQQKNQFRNLQTLSDIARLSNGSLFFYPEFNYYTTGMKFSNELYTVLTRQNAWEAVFRIRTSTGFNQIGTYGNKLIKQKTADLIVCPIIDKDRVIVYELERLSESQADPEKRRLMAD